VIVNCAVLCTAVGTLGDAKRHLPERALALIGESATARAQLVEKGTDLADDVRTSS
jgi:hypothetical protein